MRHLNLSAFRKGLFRPASHPHAIPDRRSFIRSMAALPLMVSPDLLPLSIRVAKQGHRILFLDGQRELWSLDTRWFEGSPSLKLNHEAEKVVFHLHDAFFPGTKIRADLKATVTQGIFGQELEIHMPGIGFRGQVPLVNWLKGKEALQSTASQTLPDKLSHNTLGIHIAGNWNLEMYPNWQFEFKGKTALCANGDKCEVRKLTFRPGFEIPKNLLNSKPKKATTITFDDEGDFTHVFDANRYLLLSEDYTNKFNWLKTTNKEDIFWTDSSVANSAQLKLGSEEIPLQSVSIAGEMGSRSGYFLMGRMRNEEQWLSTATGSVLIRRKPKYPDLEIQGSNFKPVRLRFGPEYKASFSPVSNAVALPVYDGNRQIEFDTLKKRKRGQAKLALNDNKLHLLDDEINVRVLRPDDLLLLEFKFINCRFQKRDQLTFLTKDRRNQPSRMIVYFQPQHQLEQAFYEENDIPDPQSFSNDSIQLPAQFIRSGKSRLVYDLPEDFSGIPLTMDALLDWRPYSLRVNPRARAIQLSITAVKTKDQLLLSPPGSGDMPATREHILLGRQVGVPALVPRKTKIDQHALLTDEKALNQIVARSVIEEDVKAISRRFQKASRSVGPAEEDETSIEAPAWLFISPNQLNSFAHTRHVKVKIIEPSSDNQQLQISSLPSYGKGELVELWHTRMGVKAGDNKIYEEALVHLRTIRALWGKDVNEKFEKWPNRNTPFRASLDAYDRHNIVHQTSNYSFSDYKPEAVEARKLYLSSLGAYLDLYKEFNAGPDKFVLKLWEHRATLGRDHYVKVVEKGYLFPFGHEASVVKITERKLDDKTKAAVNRQRMYVVVTQPVAVYSERDENNTFRSFPFGRVQIRTLSTPDISAPANIVNEGGKYNFWIEVGGSPFEFNLDFMDREMQGQSLSAPLIFVGSNFTRFDDLINAYNENYPDQSRVMAHGQQVAYANSLLPGDTSFPTETMSFSAEKGAGRFLPTVREAEVHVKAIEELTGSKKAVRIIPVDDQNDANVFVEVSDLFMDFSGNADKSGGILSPNSGITSISKTLGPLGPAGDENNPEIFSSFDDFDPEQFFGQLGENTPVAKLFGVIRIFELILADADFTIAAGDHSKELTDLRNVLDQQKASLSSLENALAEKIREYMAEVPDNNLTSLLNTGNLNPSQLREEFENLCANSQVPPNAQAICDSYGSIKSEFSNAQVALEETVTNMRNKLDEFVPRIPNLKTYRTEEAVVVEYIWNPVSRDKVSVGLLEMGVGDPETAFSVFTRLTRPYDTSQQSELYTNSSLKDFYVQVNNMIRVRFEKFDFIVERGKKPAVDVALYGTTEGYQSALALQQKDGDGIPTDQAISFLGPLTFVNNLQNLIPFDGFGGAYINLQPTNIRAGFDIGIPNVEVGILSITNLTLGAYVSLPFTGEAMVIGFNFCKRESPFNLTISCFGGGGFLLMETQVDRFRRLEAAFEFAAALSFNVGVASGGVSAAAGFYFELEIENNTEKIELSGYVRINGALSILGLITISMEIYVALTAAGSSGKIRRITGVAKITVKVEVLMFSKAVSFKVERSLKAADGDPKFAEMIEEPDWLSYCQAFA